MKSMRLVNKFPYSFYNKHTNLKLFANKITNTNTTTNTNTDNNITTHKPNTKSFKSFESLDSKATQQEIHHLKSLLSSERQHEEKEYQKNQKPNNNNNNSNSQYIHSCLSNSGFHYSEESNSSNQLKLSKFNQDYHIQIFFKAKEPFSYDYSNELINNYSKDIHRDFTKHIKEDEFIKFQILLTKNTEKKNKDNFNSENNSNDSSKSSIHPTNGLFFKCENFNSNNFVIHQIYSCDDITKVHEYYKESANINVNFPNDEIDIFNHINYQDLSMQIKTDFNMLLKDVGIDQDVIKVIELIAEEKDSKLYMNWIKEVDEFFV